MVLARYIANIPAEILKWPGGTVRDADPESTFKIWTRATPTDTRRCLDTHGVLEPFGLELTADDFRFRVGVSEMSSKFRRNRKQSAQTLFTTGILAYYINDVVGLRSRAIGAFPADPFHSPSAALIACEGGVPSGALSPSATWWWRWRMTSKHGRRGTWRMSRKFLCFCCPVIVVFFWRDVLGVWCFHVFFLWWFLMFRVMW